MGLGLFLKGRYPGTEKNWLAKAEEWAQANADDVDVLTHVGTNGVEQPTLFLHLHPSAENVEITEEAPGQIVVSAKTSTTGPGYHVYLCDLLQRLGEDLSVEWQEADEDSGDETGYFHDGDREGLEQEMLTWLKAMAGFILENKSGDLTGFMIAMPLGHTYFGDDDDQRILTQLGPRDLAWFTAVAEDPSRGLDFFPWWDSELDAPYYRDRALCLMWQDVRWRPPIDDDETDVLAEVADLLETAYDLDQAGIELPWAEWHEILGYLEEHDTDPKLVELIAKRAKQASGPRVGYRRGRVKVTVAAGWTIDIPGSFAEKWDDEGKTWCAWDEGRTIWFTSFSLESDKGPARPAEECLELMPLEGEGERLDHRHEHLVGRAIWAPGEEDGEPVWQLQALTAAPGGAALLTICVEDPKDKDWAIRAWRSVHHPGPEKEEPAAE